MRRPCIECGAVAKGTRCQGCARRHESHRTRRRTAGRANQRRRRQVLAAWAGICWICGRPGADTVDHVIRLADGGTDDLANLRAAHLACNLRRG